jgi:hypothetical protein
MGEAVIPSLGLPIGAMAAILNGILLRQSWRDGAFAAPTAEEAEHNAQAAKPHSAAPCDAWGAAGRRGW